MRTGLSGEDKDRVLSMNGSAKKTLLMLALVCATPVGAELGAAVVGSFSDIDNAKRVRSALLAEHDLDAMVVEAEVRARTIYRVMVSSEDGRALVSFLKARGFPDTWFMPQRLIRPEARERGPVPPPVARRAPARRATGQPASRPASSLGAPEQVSPGRDPVAIPLQAGIQRSPDVGDELTALAEVVAPARGTGNAELLEVIDGIPRHHIRIDRMDEADLDIVIDGRVDEPVWRTVNHYDNMIVAVPGTGKPGEYPTELRFIASEKGLYASAVMKQPPETLVSRLSQRDDFIDRDNFGVTLDTTGRGLFAYWTIVGLGDSQMDGKVLPERNYSRDWDGPWIAKTAQLEDGWSAEMYYPWSMMNLADVDGPRIIGFAVSRGVSHTNERYQWPGYAYSSSRFVSALNTLEVTGVDPRQQISVIPYSSSTIDQARDDDEWRAGLDLTWRPSTWFELSASLYPDFGAVEADDIILNLTAAETFFPEKRLFFLEGNEVFETFKRSNPMNIMRIITNADFATTSRRIFMRGFTPPPTSLMNTRRIGGTAKQVSLPDGVTVRRGERDLPTDLLGAVKVTGKLGNVRYGVLGALEDDVSWLGSDENGDEVDIEDEGRDYLVSRIVWERVGEDRRAVGYLGTAVEGPLFDAYVHGIDAHMTSASGSLISDMQLAMSEVADVTGYAAMFDVMYASGPHTRHKVELDYFDEDVRFSDLGFLRRNDNATFQYAFLYDDSDGLAGATNLRGTVVVRQQYNVSRGQVTDSGIFWRNSFEAPGRNTVRLALGYLPERYEDINSRGNGAYLADDRWWLDAGVATDAGKMVSMSIGVGGTQEDLGGWTYEGRIGATIRPGSRVAIDVDLDYRRRHGWLVYQGGRDFGAFEADEWQPRVRINWFMAPGHELKFSLQWVGVRAFNQGLYAVPDGDGRLVPAARTRNHDFTVSMVTTQLRYRWAIAPLTDFYLVYNRGNNLPNTIGDEFSSLFRDAFTDPVVDSFIAKFRYRFGD